MNVMNMAAWVFCMQYMHALVNAKGCTISDEFRFRGQGKHRYYIPLCNISFCFLTDARAWNFGGCQLSVDPVQGFWFADVDGKLNEFECGIRCATHCTVTHSAPDTQLTGIGNNRVKLHTTPNTVCMLNGGHSWWRGGEACSLQVDPDYWVLAAASDQQSFACRAHCVTIQDQDINVPKGMAVLEGSGTALVTLSAVENSFCFLAYGRAIFHKSEACSITQNGLFWQLQQESRQNEFGCGAWCVLF
jgi:hypothetical protein